MWHFNLRAKASMKSRSRTVVDGSNAPLGVQTNSHGMADVLSNAVDDPACFTSIRDGRVGQASSKPIDTLYPAPMIGSCPKT
jgi:hypothetical protein